MLTGVAYQVETLFALFLNRQYGVGLRRRVSLANNDQTIKALSCKVDCALAVPTSLSRPLRRPVYSELTETRLWIVPKTRASSVDKEAKIRIANSSLILATH